MIERTERLLRVLRRDTRWLALAVLVLVVLLAWLGLVAPYLHRYRGVDLQLESLQRQRAALVAYVHQAPEIEASLDTAAPDADLRLPAAERNLASADLQAQVERLMRSNTDQPCAIRSRQDVSSQRSEAQGTVVVRFEVECEYETFSNFLHAAEAARPLLFVDGLLLSSRHRGLGAADPDAGILLSAQIEVLAYLDSRSRR